MKVSAAVLTILVATAGAFGQVDSFCREFGHIATLDGPKLSAPYVYGRVNVNAASVPAKFPKITITYSNRSMSPNRVTVGRSGNYCFKITSGSGGVLVIDVEGREVARRQVSDFNTPQQREDFDISVNGSTAAQAGVVSTKFYRPPNDKTVELYREAADAEQKKSVSTAAKLVARALELDPEDYVGWAYLGTLHMQLNSLAEAEQALRRSIELKPEYPTPWVNMGRLRAAQKQYEAAIGIYQHAAGLEPENAGTFQLLGEAYLLNKQGTLGAQALNHALRLDPVGMAECHLQLAHLFRLAGANDLASREYKRFLEKVKDHPDSSKFKEFMAMHPPAN